MNDLVKNIMTLCSINGTSGNEGSVRNKILSMITPLCDDVTVDNLGNIIAVKLGLRTPSKKLMLASHMDEIGFIITYICDDGTLKFETVGGVDSGVILGSKVLINENISGVIGTKPTHLLDDSERKKIPPIEKLCIDIGASSKAETESLVKPGDTAVFISDSILFGNGMIKAKAIDDRAGCAVLIELMKTTLPIDCTFVFNVQEEIGLRGAKVSAYTVAPDYALVLEATTAADIPGISGEKRVCSVGDGAVVAHMDKSTIYDRGLYNLAFETAAKHEIAIQTKTVIAGGNDAASIQRSGHGVRTLGISFPARYIHSPSCVISVFDTEEVYALTKELISEIAAIV